MTYSPYNPYGIQKERVQRKRDEEAKRELEKYRQEEQRRLAEERAQGMSALSNASFLGRWMLDTSCLLFAEAPVAVGRGRGRGLSNLPAWMVKQVGSKFAAPGGCFL